MRPKKHETTGSGDLFRARLDQIINMRHELAPALRLLEPHALAAVTNIAWLEEYDPRLLERPLKCLERACPRIGSAALDILDRDLGYPRRFCQIDLCPPDQGARRPNLPHRDHGGMLHLGNHL
jgi:hypothetical protein